MARYRGELRSYDAAQMATLALSNAEDMLKDAKLLFEHGRYSRATALSIITIEEVAKWAVVIDEFVKTGNGDWKAFWEKVRSHTTKIDWHKYFRLNEALKFYYGSMGELPRAASVIEDEGDLQAIKEGCLYVDYDGGMVTSPRNHEKTEAQRILNQAEHFVNAIFRPLPPLDAWAESLEERRNMVTQQEFKKPWTSIGGKAQTQKR